MAEMLHSVVKETSQNWSWPWKLTPQIHGAVHGNVERQNPHPWLFSLLQCMMPSFIFVQIMKHSSLKGYRREQVEVGNTLPEAQLLTVYHQRH